MRIIIIGPAGSGKGTYADLLSEKFKIPHLATGELLRQLAKTTDYGKELKKKYWGKGILVPDDITTSILRQKLGESFILEGFPRNLGQVKLLDTITKIDFVVNLKVSDKTIIDRISGRLQCKKCGAIYHVRNKPPKKDRLCDNDGTKLYVRFDDKNMGVIKERLKVFKEQTKPVIAHYKHRGILKEVDGDGKIDVVFKSILKALGKK